MYGTSASMSSHENACQHGKEFTVPSSHVYEPLTQAQDETLQAATTSVLSPVHAPPVASESARNIDVLEPLTTLQTAKLASVFCLFWFIANWSLNAALDYTSVASATVLSSTSGTFGTLREVPEIYVSI